MTESTDKLVWVHECNSKDHPQVIEACLNIACESIGDTKVKLTKQMIFDGLAKGAKVQMCCEGDLVKVWIVYRQ